MTKICEMNSKNINHLSGVFQTREFLLGAITEFLKDGLSKNEGLVLFVTPENAVFLKEHLAFAIPEYANAIQKKQIHFLDVNQAIDFFYLGNRVSEEKFSLLIGSTLSVMKNRFLTVRVYSEMRFQMSYKSKEASKEIQRCWNKYLTDHPEVSVLCGFFISPDFNNKLTPVDENELDLSQYRLENLTDGEIGRFQMKMLLDRQKQMQLDQENSTVDELRKQLVQASKYRHIGELMSSISHSVINPITIIHGKINILKMMLKDESLNREEIVKSIETISEATARIEKLSRNVIHSSMKVKANSKEKTSTREIIETVIELTRPTLRESSITLEFVSDKEVYSSKVSMPELTQIVLNFIINAKDAIESARSLGSGKITIRETKLSESMMQLEVIDNGCGISPEHTSKVFSPFFTTKKDERNGLGLFISQNILRDQGGKIGFETKPGIGSTFKALIPL